MKFLLITSLFIIASCSSTKERSVEAPEKVSNQSFKKERPLNSGEISDFYTVKAKSLNPALQDETLDRMSKDELSQLESSKDSLIEISVACSQKDFKKAFSLASDAFNKYQKVPQYWNLVGSCHLNQGSFRKALLFYNKALEISPNYVPSLNNIGVMYSRLGQDQKALVAFEKAHKTSKFSKTPRYNLASTYLRHGLADMAQPLFQSLLNESPKDVDLLNAVASCYFLMSDYGRAQSYYQQIPKKEWSRTEIGLNFALTLKKTGKNKEAHQVFENVESPRTDYLKVYYDKIEAQLGDAE